MAIYNDIHNYALSPSSSPWRTLSAPFPTIEGGQIKMCDYGVFGVRSVVERSAPLVGNYLLQCAGEFYPTAGNSNISTAQIGFGCNSNGHSLPFEFGFPAIIYRPNIPIPAGGIPYSLPSNAWIPAGSQGIWNGAVQHACFGAWSPVYPANFHGLPLRQWRAQGSEFSFSIQFYVRPSARRVAIRLVKNSVEYRSGWHEPGNSSFTLELSRPRIVDSSNVLVGTITIIDELSDSEIEYAELTGETPADDGDTDPDVSEVSVSRIFPASTGKLSHARILRGYRTPSQAQNFHEMMRERAT